MSGNIHANYGTTNPSLNCAEIIRQTNLSSLTPKGLSGTGRFWRKSLPQTVAFVPP
jgi:hypothetical protein